MLSQTVNTGMLYVSENTKFSSVSSFKNKPEATFYNDGRTSLYADIYNEGIFDFYNQTGILRLVGNQLQEISGQEIFTTNLYLENNTPAVAFQVNSGVNIYRDAYFILGILENRISQGRVNFLPDAIAFNSSNASFVDGPVNKTGDSDFQYPIGHQNYYRPAITSMLNSANTYDATYFLENLGALYDLELKEGLIDKIDNHEYWEISMKTQEEVMLSLTWNSNTTPNFILNETSTEDAIHIVRWNAITQRWVDEGGVTNTSENTVTTAVLYSGVYTLALMKYDEVNPCDIVVFNAVTPNGDGFNDYLEISNESTSCASNLVVKIFNRWGVKVFETNNYGEPGQVFDGYSNGRLTVQQESQLPSGTYFYVLEYDYNQGGGLSKHQKAGYIHLSTE